MSETKSFFAADKRLLFLLLCLGTFLLLYVKIVFIENETAAFEFLQDRPEGTILKLINTLKYFSIPFVWLLKLSLNAAMMVGSVRNNVISPAAATAPAPI